MILNEGEKIPRGYGFSYMRWEQGKVVVFPFPVNHIIHWARELWFKVRDASWKTKETEAIKDIWRQRREIAKEKREVEEYRILTLKAALEVLDQKIKKRT